MSNIEGQRLGADLRVSEYNAGTQERTQGRNIEAAVDAARAAEAANMRAQQANASNALRAQGMANAASQASVANQFRALGGMQDLYGTTPAGSKLFGDQALAAMSQANNWGGNMVDAARPQAQGPAGPSGLQQTQQAVNIGTSAVAPYLQYAESRRVNPTAQQRAPAQQTYRAPQGEPWLG